MCVQRSTCVCVCALGKRGPHSTQVVEWLLACCCQTTTHREVVPGLVETCLAPFESLETQRPRNRMRLRLTMRLALWELSVLLLLNNHDACMRDVVCCISSACCRARQHWSAVLCCAIAAHVRWDRGPSIRLALDKSLSPRPPLNRMKCQKSAWCWWSSWTPICGATCGWHAPYCGMLPGARVCVAYRTIVTGAVCRLSRALSAPCCCFIPCTVGGRRACQQGARRQGRGWPYTVRLHSDCSPDFALAAVTAVDGPSL